MKDLETDVADGNWHAELGRELSEAGERLCESWMKFEDARAAVSRASNGFRDAEQAFQDVVKRLQSAAESVGEDDSRQRVEHSVRNCRLAADMIMADGDDEGRNPRIPQLVGLLVEISVLRLQIAGLQTAS